MAIYRGPGGAGDATNDAIVNQVASYATSAASSATNAANSASEANTSANNASTSATNAASSASQAATSASNAASSASSASSSASIATTQATNAANSATAAAASSGSASSSASNASSSAATAASKAAEAETYAIRAETAEENAVEAYADTLAVFGDATDVAAAVSAASTSATNAANSATAAATSATNAASSATSASNAASAAANSATTANAEASEAQEAANTAVAALQTAQSIYSDLDAIDLAVSSAQGSASSAATSASTATTQASNAATSATNAANSATQATNSAASAAAIVTNVATNCPSVRPTILADFGNSKQIPSNMSFSRASTATRYNEFGLLDTVASNVGRITYDPVTRVCEGYLNEPQRTNLVLESAGYDKQNLFTQSGAFDNAAWVKTRTNVTAGQADPFGGTGAFKVTENTTTNSSYVVSQNPTSPSGTPHVISVYAKKAERDWLVLAIGSLSTSVGYFNLNTGTVGSAAGTTPPTSLTITSVGNGWYRCSMVGNSTSSASLVYFGTASADNGLTHVGTVGQGIFIYGAQLERSHSTTPSAYYATTSAAYQPWVQSVVSATANSGTAPDGTNTAYKVVATSGAISIPGSSWRLQSSGFSTTIGVPYTVSAYAKASGFNVLQLRVSPTFGLTTGSYAAFRFNLSTGQLIGTGLTSTSYNATITPVGNGWYRCSVTGTSTATTSYAGILPDDSVATAGNGTDGILLWGFQVEQADSASTYIPTTTSQVTRAADVLALADSGWLNQTEGTFYVDRRLRALNNNQTLFSLDNGTSDIEVRTIQGTNSVNLLTYTEQFDAAAWVKSQMGIVPKSIMSPDGVTYADKLVPTTVSGNHAIQQLNSYTAGVTYTFSVYVKAAGYNIVRFTHPSAAVTPSSNSYWDLSTGTVGTSGNGTAGIASVGNGWYRLSFTATATSTVSTSPAFYVYEVAGVSFAGDGTSGVYFWHPQMEVASSASTYEPNPKHVTSYEIGSDGLIQTANFASLDIPNLYQKSTFAYKANDATYYRGGSSVGTDTSVTLPTAMDRLVIGGSAINSGREINGTIKKIAYYPYRLVDIEQAGATQQ